MSGHSKWSTIKRKKGEIDAARGKVFQKLAKEIYVAAKQGTPDIDSNAALRMVVEKAKGQNMPKDNIQKAIDKAKGGSDESYEEARYEGFGPGASTIIVDCLTDNTNRSLTNVKTAFNKAHGAKIGNAGSVSFNYEHVGLFVFPYEDEEGMLDALIAADVDVQELSVEEGVMTVTTPFTDFGKAQDAIENVVGEIEFEVCETTMLPNEYVELTDPEEAAEFQKLLDLLNEVDDVNKVYTNVKSSS